MALLNNAQMTVSGAPGTAAFTLNAAVPGAQTWDAAGAANGGVYSYRAEGAAGWEIGSGLYTAAGKTLGRVIILASSNGNAAVSFGADVVVSQVALPGDIPPGSSLRNRVMNGSLMHWQRGTSAADAKFGADRWRAVFSNGSVRSSDVPSGAPCLYSAEVVNASGSTGASYFQNIPAIDTADLAGGFVSISFYAKSTAGTASLSASLSYVSGQNQDDFSTITAIGTVMLSGALSSAWSLYTVRFFVPAAATKGLQLVLGRGAGVGVGTRYTGIQLEPGAQPSPLEWRGNLELTLCQRHYQTGVLSLLGGAHAPGVLLSTTVPFYPPMFAAPTLTYVPFYEVAVGSKSIGAYDQRSFRLFAPATDAGTNIESSGTWTAEAEP